MAQLRKIRVTVETQVELIIDEEELRALDALFGYSIDSFIKFFYEHLGRHYLQPHEDGLRRLAETIRGCNGLAREADECREFLNAQAKSKVLAMKE